MKWKRNFLLLSLFPSLVLAADIGQTVDANNKGMQGIVELSDLLADGEVLKVDEYSANNSSICFDSFPNGVMPLIYSRSIAENSIMLCYPSHVVSVNKTTKVPVFSAEYINAPMILSSSQLPPHKPKFTDYRREKRLPISHQALIDNYESLQESSSLYAMTELTPSINQTSDRERDFTTRLSNIAPINRKLRDGLLSRINNGIRKFTYEQGKEAYIVTGTHYEGSSYRIGDVNGVAVPNYIYKAFYFPVLGIGSAYWIKNDEVNTFDVISLLELQKRIKIDLFPEVPISVKRKMVYPPRPYSGDNSYLGDYRRLDDIDVNYYLNEKEKGGVDLKVHE